MDAKKEAAVDKIIDGLLVEFYTSRVDNNEDLIYARNRAKTKIKEVMSLVIMQALDIKRPVLDKDELKPIICSLCGQWLPEQKDNGKYPGEI